MKNKELYTKRDAELVKSIDNFLLKMELFNKKFRKRVKNAKRFIDKNKKV